MLYVLDVDRVSLPVPGERAAGGDSLGVGEGNVIDLQIQHLQCVPAGVGLWFV